MAPFIELGDALCGIVAGVDLEKLACPSSLVAPHVLPVATILQCAEGLTDLETVEAARTSAAWRYALHLPLAGRVLDAASLRGFRVRLLEDRDATRAFAELLVRVGTSPAGRSVSPLPASTAALVDALQTLNLLGLALRAMRLAGHALAVSRQAESRGVFPEAWKERYLEVPLWTPLPRSIAERERFALGVASDGFLLLDAAGKAFAGAEASPPRELEALRQTWEWLFEREGPFVGWRGRPRPPGFSRPEPGDVPRG